MNDNWIKENSPLGAERMHALGAIAFSWNMAEYWSLAILTDVIGVREEVTRNLAHDMSMVTVWTKIVDVAGRRGFPDDIVSGLDGARKCFESNRLNRNLYIHALASASGSGLRMTKNKGPQLFGDPIDDSLETMRRVHGDIDTLKRLLSEISMVIGAHQIEGKILPFPEIPPQSKTIQLQTSRPASRKP